MGFVWEWAAWLAGDAGAAGSGMAAGPNSARAVVNGVTVAANAYVARVLYRFCRDWPGERFVSKLVAVFAGLVVLCGASHLALLLVGRATVAVVPKALEVLAAALWVAVAVRLPALACRLSRPLPGASWRAAVPAPPADLARASAAIALKAGELRARIRVLKTSARNQTGPLGRADARNEVRDDFDDLEADTCKI